MARSVCQVHKPLHFTFRDATTTVNQKMKCSGESAFARVLSPQGQGTFYKLPEEARRIVNGVTRIRDAHWWELSARLQGSASATLHSQFLPCDPFQAVSSVWCELPTAARLFDDVYFCHPSHKNVATTPTTARDSARKKVFSNKKHTKLQIVIFKIVSVSMRSTICRTS